MDDSQLQPSTPTDRPGSPERFDREAPESTRVPDSAAGGIGATAGTASARYGRFAVLRFHAKGGLGEVYLALDEELRRDVALKRMQESYAGDPAARRRFLNEAEITARLEHPGIVPIYGLVHDEYCRPCYAMRFIAGQSLLEAVKGFHGSPNSFDGLSFRALLQRFISVCNTIAYAHSKHVIHRDIKPGNVMLGRFEETLVVDWGLAREIADSHSAGEPQPGVKPPTNQEVMASTVQGSPSGTDDRIYTQPGQALGTRGYMAPEQAAGRWDIVGPCSDIYSLGATLYEMLTGRRPVCGGDPFDALQQAQAGDFPRPRAVKAGVPEALEAICLKAMALQPQDRYGSAKELAADLEHWLADEPIAAWREPWTVRARRRIRRHRMAVASGVAALAVLTVSLGIGTALLDAANGRLREANQREEALRTAADEIAEKAKVAQQSAEEGFAKAKEAVVRYLKEVTDDEDLKLKNDLHPLRKRLLEAAIPFYEWLTKQKPGEAALEIERGWAYHRLAYVRAEMGEYRAAIANYEQMRDLFSKLASAFPEVPKYRSDLAASYNWLGVFLNRVGQVDGAEAAYQETIALWEKLLIDHPGNRYYRHQLANGYWNLANLLAERRQRQSAEKSYRKAIAIFAQLVSDFPQVPDYPQGLANSYLWLGSLLAELRQTESAEKAYQGALPILEKLTTEHPAVGEYRRELATTQMHLGMLLTNSGRLEAAERYLRQALTIQEKLAANFPTMVIYRAGLGANHSNLGILLRKLGRQADAESCFSRARDLYDKLVAECAAAPTHREELAKSQDRLGDLYHSSGRWQPAESAYADALAVREQLVADFPERPEFRQDLATNYDQLGNLHDDAGRGSEAESAYNDALAVRKRLVAHFPNEPEFRQQLASNWHNLRSWLRRKGRPKEAEAAHDEAMRIREQLARDFPDRPEYRRSLADSFYNLGARLKQKAEPIEAEKAYAEAQAVYKQLAADFPARPEFVKDLGDCHAALADLYRETSRPSEAESALVEALAVRKQLAAEFPDRPEFCRDLASSHDRLANLLEDLGRRKEAEAAYGKAFVLLKQLASNSPSHPEIRHELAINRYNLGVCFIHDHRLPEAEAAYCDARAVYERLVAEFPARQEFRKELGDTRNVLADIFKDTSRPKEAEAAYREARALRELLEAEFPTSPDFRNSLAATHGDLADLLKDANRLKEAEQAYRQALGIRRHLVIDFPAVPKYHSDLGNILDSLAALNRNCRNFAGARKLIDEAFPHHQAALRAKPKESDYQDAYRQNRSVLIGICAGDGNRVAALDVAKKLRDLGWDPASDAYDAACGLAQCIPVVEKNHRAGRAKRRVDALFFTHKAIAMLRQAVAKGYNDVTKMKKDKDLDPLRHRADFQKLVKELEEKHPPSKDPLS